MNRIYHIAIIPGDGIGTEVISEGIKCLKTLSEIFKDLRFRFEYFPWGSDYYLQQGRMMPEGGLKILKDFDAIYLGAVGDPRIPDDITLHGLLLPIRMEFDLYVGLRPVSLFPGIESALANISEGEIDIVVIRENSEGEYSNIGGIAGNGLANPVAAILTAKLMLDYLREFEAAQLLYEAVKKNLSEKKIRTVDLGGHSRTDKIGDDVVRILQSFSLSPTEKKVLRQG